MGQIDTIHCLCVVFWIREFARNQQKTSQWKWDSTLLLRVIFRSTGSEANSTKWIYSSRVHILYIVVVGREHLSCIRITTTFFLHYVMHSVWRLSSHMRSVVITLFYYLWRSSLKIVPVTPNKRKKFPRLSMPFPIVTGLTRINANDLLLLLLITSDLWRWIYGS